MDKDDNVEDGVHESHHVHERSDLRGDEKNIATLLFLYLLQGIPLGLCSSIPMLLQNRDVSYRQQVLYVYIGIVSNNRNDITRILFSIIRLNLASCNGLFL